MNDDSVRIFAQIQKGQIDHKNRIVYGIAQLDDGAPDLQNDIVDWSATKRAFNRWFHGINKGNVREMHRKDMAVGNALLIKPLDETKQMLVGVRVSKGAESTWQKVLDGTLRGFSIGGHALRTAQEYVPALGRKVNKVLDYVLTELSLVDVPANPQCRILGITKNFVAPGLTGDVTRKAGLMKNAALEAIVGMAKTVAPDDELILVKRADITIVGEGDEAKIHLDGNADVSEVIKGADLSEISTAVDEAIEKGMGSNIDVEALASLAKGLQTICKSVGLDVAELVKDEPLELGKGLDRAEVTDLVKAAVGEAVDGLADMFADLKKSVDTITAGGVMPRKIDGTGEPVIRAITKLSDGTTEGGDADLQKRLADAYQKRDALIAKMDAGQSLSAEDQVLRKNIGEEIDRLEARASGRTQVVKAI